MCAMLCYLLAMDLLVYYRVTDRHGRGLHMVKKEKRMEKQQPTEPDPVTSRPRADPLAAEPWLLTASIYTSPTLILMWMCSK